MRITERAVEVWLHRPQFESVNDDNKNNNTLW